MIPGGFLRARHSRNPENIRIPATIVASIQMIPGGFLRARHSRNPENIRISATIVALIQMIPGGFLRAKHSRNPKNIRISATIVASFSCFCRCQGTENTYKHYFQYLLHLWVSLYFCFDYFSSCDILE